MPKKADGWCVKEPDGRFNQHTFGVTRDHCWSIGFDYMDDDFRNKYWKRWDGSQREASRRGYKIVRVRLVEVKHV